ncbi:hypothetical protein B5X24_HaOG201687 [Helicoverpa armigera]|nr:hypothetical protein B5X24_HaOG201687 [Helicoverpa armigera]
MGRFTELLLPMLCLVAVIYMTVDAKPSASIVRSQSSETSDSGSEEFEPAFDSDVEDENAEPDQPSRPARVTHPDCAHWTWENRTLLC